MKVLFYANTDWYLYNFRLALLKAVSELGHDVVLVSPPGKYGPKLQTENLRWCPLPLNRRALSPLSEFPHLLRLRAIFKQEQPDLVHNFTIKCAVYGSIVAWTIGSPAVVNAITGLGHVFSQKSSIPNLLGPFVRLCLRISCASSRCRVILQNKGDFDSFVAERLVKAKRARLIRGSGVDISQLRPRVRNKSDSSPMVLFASRLLKAKGIVEFVKAARIMKERGNSCRFVIAGAIDLGNPGTVLESELSEWQSWGCVEFLGHRDNIPDLLSEASIVVLVSSYGEGIPRILIEGAACGLPLITSDQPGCREIVEDRVNGLVVPVGDETALVSAISYLLENPAERQRMGMNGRKRVLAEFNVERVIDETFQVYRELQPNF